MQYCLKLSTSSQKLAYSAVFASKFKPFFDNKPNQSLFLGIRVQPDLQAIGFRQRNALQCTIPVTPHWLLSHPCVNFYLHCFCKDNTARDIFRSKFYEESGLIVALLKTPLLSDPVDTYAEMSRRKHPFNLVHKLYNGLRHICEINKETAKNGHNRQHCNSLNSTSWLRP